jgi:hypothetical protein
MLPAAMPTPVVTLLLTIAALALAAVAAGCGEEEGLEVVEGEPVELGELSYNVQLTRFLNPDDTEDGEYLVDQPEPPTGSEYLGVFMTIANESEEAVASSSGYEVVDTLDARFEPVESESPYALDIGATVPPEEEIPLPDTTAQAGPVQGAMLLFLVDEAVTENRPLELEIHSGAETGTVELDI